ncbi:EF-hand domain-containing family member C2-like [Leptopilina boulardi]|uniref:EF-hand domain-containing family member C2-like n=1 Tax=Leptopilina boulardi TaxID=63433 RepID=UPI0021F5B09B|nr:EF-hand domain-containing family member C2-like [Leptopilina boulardi]
MNPVPALPFLPGFNFDSKIGKTKFHKSQIFDKIHNGVYYLAEKPHFSRHSRYLSFHDEGEKPTWLAFDGQRLMFKAYFQLNTRDNSSFSIRNCTISFFLEDGTMKVSEPITGNSGLEQGLIVRRQRIPIPDPVTFRYYDILDLNIGKQIKIYGRIYNIIDCDKFTRNFLNRNGIPVPQPIELSSDSYAEKKDIFQKKPNRIPDTRGNFLKYDKKVLRFYGYWDDRDNLYGEIHNLEIHYYLADDTIEVKEILPENSGRDVGPLFLKRSKIPKNFEKIDPIGSGDTFTILNVLGDNGAKSYYMADSLNTGTYLQDYFKDHDLTIGSVIDVFGRKVVITDLDSFTKDYYRMKYGIDNFTPLKGPLEKCDYDNKIEKFIPPYNGYGSYEDSLGNCFSVTPKAPNVDFTKFYYHDKQGFDSQILRFQAKMISKIPENAERCFIIRIFLMDNTIAIFELSKRNSGFMSCLFQKRMRVMLPGQEIFSNEPPNYYKPNDFYIGANLTLNGFLFQLTFADSYTLRYMEQHSDEFPKANSRLIMDKLRELLKPIYKEFKKDLIATLNEDGTLILEFEHFRKTLLRYLGENITEHEIITIARHYSSREKREFNSRDYIRALVHTEINRFLWTELDRLEEDILHLDRTRTGYLSRNELYRILRGCRIPLNVELLNTMLDVFDDNKQGTINYCDLLKFLNVKINPMTPVAPVNIKTALWWTSEKEIECGAKIEFPAFIEDLNLDEKENPMSDDKYNDLSAN